MRLGWKILLTLLFVAVVPVAVSGALSVLLSREAVSRAVNEKLEAEALHLSEVAETHILEAVSGLEQSAALGLGRLEATELRAALGLIYRDDTRRNAVALIDGETGEAVVDLVYQEEVGTEPGLVGHEPFREENREVFAARIPLLDALRVGKAISPPYADEARGVPLLAIAVRVDGPTGPKGAPRPWVVAVELSLRELNRRFEDARGEGLTAMLVDHEGRTVCHRDPAVAVARKALLSRPAVSRMQDPRSPSSGAVDDAANATLTAFARARRLGAADGRTWGVVVERPRREALIAVDELTRRTAFWVGVAFLLALAAGAVLARGIARPLEVLTHLVEAFGKGEALARSKLKGEDEIGRLSEAFNEMADGLCERDLELRRFNDELRLSVDERTRELKEAQDQLIQSQKMAAVGELGAGVAHEINNPLAGVLGSAQLALLRTDKQSPLRSHLEDIEREALRIREIVQSLLKLSSEREAAVAGRCDLNELLESALSLFARSIIGQRIQVKKELDPKLPKVRGRSADLQQVLMQLIANARDAMADGGVLTLRTESIDSKLAKVIIADTGAGIAEANLEKVFEPFFTTRAGKGHKGMGLAIVHRIVEEHQGRVALDSRLGKGTKVRVTFPATREKLHLT